MCRNLERLALCQKFNGKIGAMQNLACVKKKIYINLESNRFHYRNVEVFTQIRE